MLTSVRSFSLKDQEVVLLARPPTKSVRLIASDFKFLPDRLAGSSDGVEVLDCAFHLDRRVKLRWISIVVP
jgi:hypothetical protein